MANWTGQGRTNYVKPTNKDDFLNFVHRFGLRTEMDSQGRYAVFPSTFADDGSLSGTDEDEDVEFTLEGLMDHVAEGEVLVAMTTGHEKARYVTGYAEAYTRQGGEVRRTYIDLGNIYQKAAEVFGVYLVDISHCEY